MKIKEGSKEDFYLSQTIKKIDAAHTLHGNTTLFSHDAKKSILDSVIELYFELKKEESKTD